MTITLENVPLVVAALGGGDVLALLEANGEAIYLRGEKSWLDEHDIPYEFWSWRS